MQLTFDFIPLKHVLSDIFMVIDDSVLSEDDIYETAAAALGMLTTNKYYESALCLADVKNYRALVPTHMKELDFVLYKESFDPSEIEAVFTSTSKIEVDQTNVILSKAAFVNFVQCSSCTLNWKLLQMANSPLSLIKSNKLLCDKYPSITNCEHSFTYNYSTKSFVTTFEKGTLLIAYKRWPKNEEGDFLVPNLEEVKNAIRSYVLAIRWLKEVDKKTEGAVSLYRQFLAEWELLSAKAKVMLIMPREYDYIKLARLNTMLRVDRAEDVWNNISVENFKF